MVKHQSYCDDRRKYLDKIVSSDVTTQIEENGSSTVGSEEIK